MTDRRATVSWCLYDFANSFYAAVIIATVWAAYYANAIVGNAEGAGDLWWGRAVSLTMLTVAVSSPLAGALSDCGGLRKKLLLLYTLVSVTGTALLATVEPGMVVYGFVLTVVATVAFEGAAVFYNAYLPLLAPPDAQGRLSGWGFATGYAGSLLGLAGALPLVNAGRYDAAFLLVAGAFLLFALPAFIWLPPDRATGEPFRKALAGGLQATWRTAREIARTPDLRRFMLAYFAYIDGVNTVIYFSSIFAAHTLGFAMSELILVFIVVQIAALAGALAWAGPTDRWGPRRVVLVVILQWLLVVVAAYFVQSKLQFWFLAAVAGTGLGAIQSASRAFMARMIPAGREAEFFGFYALSGKTASIFGPLAFGLVSSLTRGNQRLAILTVLVLLLAGGLILRGVRAGGPEARGPRAAHAG